MKMINLVLYILLLANFKTFANDKVENKAKEPNSATEQFLKLSDKYDSKVDFTNLNFSSEIDDKTNKSSCQYPNDNIHPGNSIYPIISDNRRVESILNLIGKISQCIQLPYKEDGQIFTNKEGILPEKPQGYYREYTLILPKDAAQQFYVGNTLYTALPSYSERGSERIVIGGGATIYYTPTHYKNFIELQIK
jgi:guanyl-specific ribonuclease Sa